MDEGWAGDDLGEVIMAVDVEPEWDDPLDRVEEALVSAGTAGWLATDVHAGRGRVLVRTVGDRLAETVPTRTAGPGPAVTAISFDDLADRVTERLGSSPTFDVQEEGDRGAVAVGRPDDGLTAHAVAYRSGLAVTGAAIAGWSVVALDGACDLPWFEEPLHVMARGVGSTGTSVVLACEGATTAVALVRGGHVVEVLRWDRPWRRYRPGTGPGVHELEALVQTVLPPDRGTGAELASALDLHPDASHRWSDLASAPLDRFVDVRTVGRALGLPAAVAEAVIEPSILERLPGAVRADPRPRRR